MVSLSPFGLNKVPLFDLLQEIKDGKIQLAEFQRSWCWENERISSLLASVSLGYPIGTMMLLEQDEAQLRLKPRLVEGVELLNPPQPHSLILDGQQRLTSLSMALFSSQPVLINRGRRYAAERRWYYLDIEQALTTPDTDRIDAIFALTATKKLYRSHQPIIDCSSPEKEYQVNFFPLSQVYNFRNWRSGYSKHWNYRSENLDLIEGLEGQIIKNFEHYQMGLYILDASLPKAAVCYIFVTHQEKPCQLNHFDLLTSQYATDNFDLRADWAERENRFKPHKVLSLLKPTDFLQSLALLTTYYRRLEAKERDVRPDRLPGISSKRQEILNLEVSDYLKWVEPLCQGFEAAAKFFHSQAIYRADDLPYSMQLVIMASLFAILGEGIKLDTVRAKLEQWFYCGAASGIYARSQEVVAAKDLLEMPLWVLSGGETPKTVKEAYLTGERLQGFVNSNGSAYRAISALLRRDRALDFLTGEPITCAKYFDEKIENHHIFPQRWCKERGIPISKYNSIVNKTPLRMQTNRFLGSQAPSVYLARLEQRGLNRERIEEILRSHLIEPELLRRDDFEGFFEERTRQLLRMVEKVMGKSPNSFDVF